MPPQAKFRSLLALGLVVFLHIALVFLLRPRLTSPNSGALSRDAMQYIVIQAPKLAAPKALSKPVTRSAFIAIKSTTMHEVHAAVPITSVTNPEQPTGDTRDSPTLDLDTLRASTVQEELTRKRSPIELQNERNLPNRSFEARVENAANEAQRPDCRNAYSGAGIFAPLLVAKDLIRDKGCKF